MKMKKGNTMNPKVTQIMVLGALTDEEADDLVRSGIRKSLAGHDWATGVVGAAPKQGATDVAGVVYDGETAIDFAHEMTGIDRDVCRSVILSRGRYELGMGIVADDVEYFETTAEELRKKYPQFFKPKHLKERYVAEELERGFIAAETGVDPKTVAAVLDADLEYMRRLGLLA